MQEQIRHTIEIGCTPNTLYRYVTQPWLWHEWHPNSRSAQASVSELSVGDGFDEVIELQPLSPLPFTLRRETRYTVLNANPDSHWCVEGRMSGGWLQIDYRFRESAGGVEFTRTLTYETRGLNRLLAPLLRPRMRQMSLLALTNLKARLEVSG
ncbi:SRPBCC family protein [Marinobacter mobilis]|uniref:Polyketide cyclase / dehydrase and lipid transport n=1 Tax=Marinobacter mobilis TaxID=488533 RepID=A0A1H2W769_9GAMM|nr:SRPBCC family protein [Marinobacter mobilis]SDW76378.1 Polyketide cyclase / dehydrase and lipid transport [Marinobacter mobilis]SDX53428.1 Polyketide cyclase / dehydrase and lipid transport [Marinobacter mobilis]